jgi:hypothetical protein
MSVTQTSFSRVGEGLVQQIVGDRKTVARIRRRLGHAPLFATQAKLLPEPDNPVPPRIKALRDQLWMQAQWPIGLPGLHMCCLDRDLQSLVALRALLTEAL